MQTKTSIPDELASVADGDEISSDWEEAEKVAKEEGSERQEESASDCIWVGSAADKAQGNSQGNGGTNKYHVLCTIQEQSRINRHINIANRGSNQKETKKN